MGAMWSVRRGVVWFVDGVSVLARAWDVVLHFIVYYFVGPELASKMLVTQCGWRRAHRQF